GRPASSAWKHCSHWFASEPIARSIMRFLRLLSIFAVLTSSRNLSVALLIAALPSRRFFVGRFDARLIAATSAWSLAIAAALTQLPTVVAPCDECFEPPQAARQSAAQERVATARNTTPA